MASQWNLFIIIKSVLITYIFKGGKGGSRREFTNKNVAFFTSHETNSAFVLCHVFGGDLCIAINLREASRRWVWAHTEVLSYIKRLKSKVFLLVKIIWPDFWFHFFNSSSMYVYGIEDFSSSRFTECISITIHRTVFQCIMIHGHQNWSITASQK